MKSRTRRPKLRYRAGPGGPRERGRVVAALLIACGLLHPGSETVFAQKLRNRGTFTNTGTLAVRDSVIGLPSSIGGVVMLTGENQLVPASMYQNLALTSPAVTTKWAQGNLYIADTLLVGSNVTFQLPTDSSVTLSSATGRLTETGYVAGKIKKSVDLQGSTTSSDFGGIGAAVSWSGTEPGSTLITRTSGSALNISGANTISRYYDITVTDSDAFASLALKHTADELQGQDPNTLEMWRLPPGQTRWRRQRTTRGVQELSTTNVKISGRFAFADASNPLDPISAEEWIPAQLAHAGPDSVTGVPGDSIAVSMQVVDAFGQGVAGVAVQFALTDSPDGASGQLLTIVSGITDETGTVSTKLILGNEPGVYEVTGTTPSEPSVPPTVFTGITGSTVAMVDKIAGDGQRGRVTETLLPLIVRLSDADDFRVPGYSVRFSIVGRPLGDSAAAISDSIVTTDGLGRASVVLTLGQKTGVYTVRAAPVGIDSLEQFFTDTASAGPATMFVPPTGLVTVDTVLQAAPPMVYTITDSYGNAVEGIPVTFAIAGTPEGATGQALSSTVVFTDSSGQAVSQLTLGNTAGPYTVLIGSDSLGGTVDSIVFTAEPAPASFLARVSGSGQRNQVMTFADSMLVARITDGFGNPVANERVNFAIVATPPNASGQTLTQAADTSDLNGLVSTRIFLGSSTGPYTVEARPTSLPDSVVSFSVEATHGVAGSVVILAPVIRDTVNHTAPPVVVSLRDVYANPIPESVIRFGLETPLGAQGQWLSADSLLTNEQGDVTIVLHFGDKAGPYIVSATADLLPDSAKSFTALASADREALMVEFEKPVAPRTILTRLDTSFTTRVTDLYGNPVSGVPVTFSIIDTPATATGHALSKYYDSTNVDGRAWTNLTLGLKAGLYRVRAAATGLPPVEFEATAIPGAPKAAVAAVSDTTLFIGESSMPLVVTVIDTGGNAVPGRLVTFETAGAPSGAAGYALSAQRDTTDQFGRASTILTAGNKPGRYLVAATVDDLPSAVFAIRVLDVKGNPNLDDRVDIADLTAIIDHILGRTPLTGPAFIGADVDSNGTVDLFDAIITRDYILNGGRWVIDDSSVVVPTELAAEVNARMNEEPNATPSKATDDEYPSGNPANSVAMLEFSNFGIRLNLTNDIPVKGLQVFLRLKRTVPDPVGDVKFARAAHMRVFISGAGNEVYAVAYNLANMPIDTGSGPIFRIPLAGLDTADVDSVAIIVSSGLANTSTQVEDQQVIRMPAEYPTTFALYQNYPNPFNAETKIEYDIPELSGRIARVTIQVFNILGEKVATIERGERDAGTYRVIWNGRDEYGNVLATGAYFYRLVSLDVENRALYTTTKKMLYLK